MVPFAFISFFALFLVGILVAGVVLAAILIRKARWWLLGGVLLLAMMAVFLVFFVAVARRHAESREAVPAIAFEEAPYRAERPGARPMPSAKDEAAPAGPEAPSVEATPRATTSSSSLLRPAWDDDPPGFLADVYPSDLLATRALARNLAGSLDGAAGPESGPMAVQITGDGVPAGHLEQAQEAFRKLLPSARIEFAESSPSIRRPQPGQGAVVSCTVHRTGPRSGAVHMVLTTASSQVNRSASFEAKDWCADVSGFLARSRGRQIVGRSAGTCATPDSARQAAIRDAASQLLPQVRHALNRGLAAGRYRPGSAPTDPAILEFVEDELSSPRCLEDQFVQRVSRPYGNLWRHAVLVDASPAAVKLLAARSTAQTAAVSRMAFWRRVDPAIAVGIVALLTLVVYALLNFATKGYFAWTLRIVLLAAAMAVAVGVLLVKLG